MFSLVISTKFLYECLSPTQLVKVISMSILVPINGVKHPPSISMYLSNPSYMNSAQRAAFLLTSVNS